MSPPPDGVTAQSRWPCGTAIRTYSLYWQHGQHGYPGAHIYCAAAHVAAALVAADDLAVHCAGDGWSNHGVSQT